MTPELKGNADDAARARTLGGGKVTIIEQPETAPEAMVTHYYVVGPKPGQFANQRRVQNALVGTSRTLRDSGFTVTRLKLEFDLTTSNDPQLGLRMGEYAEAHVKCLVSQDSMDWLKGQASDHDWRPSRNPLQKNEGGVVQFVNRRFTKDTPWTTIERLTVAVADTLSRHATVIEAKIESVFLDTFTPRSVVWEES
jgi:hypothetical protein